MTLPSSQKALFIQAAEETGVHVAAVPDAVHRLARAFGATPVTRDTACLWLTEQLWRRAPHLWPGGQCSQAWRY